jgi:hypothetical protein
MYSLFRDRALTIPEGKKERSFKHKEPRMLRMSPRAVLLLSLLLMFAALPILAQVSQSGDVDGGALLPMQNPGAQMQNPSATPSHVVAMPFRHGVPWRDAIGGPIGFAAPAGAHLSYFGGPIISNVQVVQVLYGSGSYNAQVAGTTSPTMGNFFGDLTGANSGYITLLQQYNTNISGGTGQVFGNGTFGGLFQIVPSSGNNGSTISDTQIQSELLAQINAGHLPAPVLDSLGNPNTLYMIYFPPGKTITQGGSSSCVAGGFCAYHGTTSSTLNSKHVLYGVMPDMQAGSGCSTGCGTSSVFGNYTSVTSHELTEALTDADVGIATTFAAPLAWYDMTNGEIGDICNGQQGSYTANGTTYVIQLEFSNSANNCVLPPAAGGGGSPNFTLSASPSSLTVQQGTSGSSTITVTPSGGFTGSVTLSNSALPSGVTATISPNPTTSTSTITFTATSTATTGTSTITITGTSGTLTHTTTISLTISAAGGTTQLIGNPGFENGTNTAPWTLTAGVINNSASEPPHSGSWDAWMDGYGTTHTDTSQQTVTIPSGKTSATLTFWLHIDTAETTTTTAFDTLKVQVFNTGGTLLATLGTFSNLNHATGYQQHSFSMNSFIGQTVVIKFTGTEDTSLQTSFVLDDVNLNVQ